MAKTSGGSSVRPCALVTGASSGIGAALANCFAEHDHDLVLVARNAQKLSDLSEQLIERHGVKVMVLPADLSQADAAQGLAETLRRKGRVVDVLVNNAGVLSQGAFAGMGLATHQEMIDLNINGLTAMLAQFVPPMVQRRRGRVLNVASIAAFQPVPSLATYAATKAYVLSLTESLAEEVKPFGVSATALCPGITATNMLERALDANAQVGRIPGFLIGDAEQVAQQGFEACIAGRVVCVPGVVNQAAILASRGSPRWLVRRIGGLLGRRAL